MQKEAPGTPAGKIPTPRLNPNQIQVAAQPVNTFIRPTRELVAEPPRPLELPGITGISTVGTGSTGGFSTKNSFERLAEELAPFNQNLTNFATKVATNYVEGEYQKGLNQAMQASVLLQGEREQSAEEYAADNRKVDQGDKPAALLMDSMNPYRRGGLKEGLARQASRVVQMEFTRRYNANVAEYAALPPGSSKLAELKAEVQSDVMADYGLDLSEPSTLKYFVPKANQAWDNMTATHWDDHQKVMKAQAPQIILGETTALISSAYESGVVSWQNPETGVVETATLLDDPAGFEQLLANNLTAIIDRGARRMGLGGEPTALSNKVIEQLLEGTQIIDLAQTEGAEGIPAGFNPKSLSRALSLIRTGPEMNLLDGRRRQTVGERWDVDGWKTVLSYDDKKRSAEARVRKDLIDQYEAEVAAAVDALPEGATQEQLNVAVAQIDQDDRFASLPLNDRLAARNRSMQTVETAEEFETDPVKAQERLTDLEQMPSIEFNAAEALKSESEWARRNLPRGQRAAHMSRVRSLIDEKVNEKGRFDPIVNSQAGQITTALVAQAYPTSVLELQKQGIQPTVENLRANSKAEVRQTTLVVQARAKQVAQAALREAEQKASKEGRTLSAEEKLGVVESALSKWSASAEAKELLARKPVERTSSTPGSSQGNEQAPPSAARRYEGQTYNSNQLPSLPSNDLKGYDTRPLINAQSLTQELIKAGNGEGYSTDLRQAARAAGVTPLQFLERQAKFYPAIKTGPLIERLRKRERAAGGRSAAVEQSTSSRGGGTNWLMALMSPRPAAATTLPPTLMQPGSGAVTPAGQVVGDPGGLAALVRSGEGSYNSVNYGTTGSAGTMNVTGMTIGELERMQANRQVGAVGAYQFTPGVLAQARRDAGLSPNAVMTPENQDKLFWASVLKGNKRPALTDYLKGKNDNLDAAHQALALEWAAVQGPSGRGAYDGDAAGNMASIPASRARQALRNARRALLASRGQTGAPNGLTPLVQPRGYRPQEITSRFGTQESFRRKPHEGLDLGIKQGTPMGLSVSGKVVRVHRTSSTDPGAGGGYGGFLDVRLDNGTVVRMAHLSSIPPGIRVGVRFEPNQVLAFSGGAKGTAGAGRSTGEHLHLEQLSGPMGTKETLHGKQDPLRGGAASLLRFGRS